MSDMATATTISLVRDELEKATWKDLSSDDQPSRVTRSSIRASVAQLVISLKDIRTTKEDPNSTRKFCTGSLSVQVPASMISDAEKARSDANLNNVNSLAEQNNIDRAADVFSGSFDYNVQPTDDGKKVYSETDSLGRFSDFFGELLASSLLKSSIEQTKLEADQAAAAQQAQQQAALAEQRNATLAQAKTENQLANQTITAIWRNLLPEARTALLDNQRAWIRKKTADCAVEAASASTDPTEQETARLRCDTRITQERSQSLQQNGNGWAYAQPNQ